MNGQIKRIPELIDRCKSILSHLMAVASLDSATIQQKITALEQKKKIQKTLDPLEQNTLLLLEDFKKLDSLQAIEIPQDPPQTPLTYYSLADSAGGVTEKLSLIEAHSLMSKLQFLQDNENKMSLNNYSDYRRTFKLSTEAILKLPKHGNALEVQREKMALDLSRILGLQTTHSILMEYRHRPALFIPFDKINLLSEVVKGEKMQAYLGSFKTYSHYSTVNPVGEGLQPNTVMGGFGHGLGLFYLCSDTDAIGGYNQNKGIKDNELYIFDQVISLKDKLKLDSRLSMKPTKFLTRHTRHDQGRNRTLIEDASIKDKFSALMELKHKQSTISDYCTHVINQHTQSIQELLNKLVQTESYSEKMHLRTQIKLKTRLVKDAQKIKKKLMERIDHIDTLFPKSLDCRTLDPSLIQHTMLLEKFLNFPRLYTDTGRPYRYPWTSSHSTKALTIADDDSLGWVTIRFNHPVPHNSVEMLQRQIGEPLSNNWLISNHEITIPKAALLALEESSPFPEHAHEYQAQKRYLDINDLQTICEGYTHDPHHVQMLALIERYNRVVKKYQDPQIVLNLIETIEKELKDLSDRSSKPGFVNHVLQKFHFDVHQKLTHIVEKEYSGDAYTSLKTKITSAFNAAIKLDQVSLFNQTMCKAIRQRKLNDSVFQDYLSECIQEAHLGTDHFTAIEQSKVFKHNSLQVLDLLRNDGPAYFQSSLQLLNDIAHYVSTQTKENIAMLTLNAQRIFQARYPQLKVFITLYQKITEANKNYQQMMTQIKLPTMESQKKLVHAYKESLEKCFSDAKATVHPSIKNILHKMLQDFIQRVTQLSHRFSSFLSNKPMIEQKSKPVQDLTPRQIEEELKDLQLMLPPSSLSRSKS